MLYNTTKQLSNYSPSHYLLELEEVPLHLHLLPHHVVDSSVAEMPAAFLIHIPHCLFGFILCKDIEQDTTTTEDET